MTAIELWSELNADIKKDAQGGVKKDINVDAVVSSIDNILGTFVGERVMLPQFASTIRTLLFEPLTNELSKFAAGEIKRIIELWDDRPEVLGVDFKKDPDNSYLELSIRFNIRGYAEVFEYRKNIK